MASAALFGVAHAEDDPLFEQVVAKARGLAAEPHTPPENTLPEALRDLGYDRYRDIRFRPDRALWRGESLFEVQFFHMGFLYRSPVTINVVADGQTRPLRFDPTMFNYGKNTFEEPLPQDLGFAGLRIHYPLNSPDYKDEVAVFLGASYFRVLGRGQVYGLSARGLAVNTAVDSGEEFPVFREFWLVKPGPEATTMTLYALLDSESVTGAYRFDIRPGTDTVVDVRSTLFAREDIQRLGIAPLTSMFLHGETRLRRFDDYRPEVHDSDGLLTHTGAGEWIWRPLENPPSLRVTSLMDQRPQGFGLLQRDRDFDHYLDIESRFERRPSLWVEPRGSWGRGAIHLVQIPTNEEIHDNIVTFWSPETPLTAGETRTFAYRLRATLNPMLPARELARVKRTHVGWAAVPGNEEKPPRSLRRFAVDFAGGPLEGLRNNQPVAVRMETSGGQASEVMAQPLPDGGWRASFRIMPDGGEPVDMRLHLSLRGERLSETWSFVWPPDAID